MVFEVTFCNLMSNNIANRLYVILYYIHAIKHNYNTLNFIFNYIALTYFSILDGVFEVTFRNRGSNNTANRLYIHTHVLNLKIIYEVSIRSHMHNNLK